MDILKQKIDREFERVRYPREPLIEHECDECRALEKAFTRRDWKTIEPALIRDNYDKLPLFSPPAFQYFLPAYLLHSIDNLTEDDVCEFTVYALTPSNKSMKESSEYYKARFEQFADGQIVVIGEFLDLIAVNESYLNFFADIEKGRKNLERIRAGMGEI